MNNWFETMIKRLICRHDYKRVMRNVFPDGHEEHIYICTKCGKEKRIDL